MFGRKVKAETVKLDVAVIRILDDMDTYGPDSKEYPELLSHLERLTKLRNGERFRLSKINPDTVVLAAGNILGILVIVAYEQKHVMTSKGLGFILKANNPKITV